MSDPIPDDPWEYGDYGVTVALQLQAMAPTLYANYDFLALGGVAADGQWQATPIGVSADGVYLLDGGDDDGAPIKAALLTGDTDFAQDRFKSTPLLHADFTGEVRAIALVDGERYAADMTTQNRVKFGRGLRGMWWAFGVANVDGSDFELRSIEPTVLCATKRVI